MYKLGRNTLLKKSASKGNLKKYKQFQESIVKRRVELIENNRELYEKLRQQRVHNYLKKML